MAQGTGFRAVLVSSFVSNREKDKHSSSSACALETSGCVVRAIRESLRERNSQFFEPIFCENFEIAAVQKDANLVELEKCCRTHIFLQNFVLIQPRTSPPKICKIFEKCIFRKCIFRKIPTTAPFLASSSARPAAALRDDRAEVGWRGNGRRQQAIPEDQHRQDADDVEIGVLLAEERDREEAHTTRGVRIRPGWQSGTETIPNPGSRALIIQRTCQGSF